MSTDSDAAPSPDFVTDAGPADPLHTDTPWESPSADDEPAAEAKPLKIGKKPLADVIRGLIIAGTSVLHGRLARYPIEQEQGVWLATDEEAGGMADPLARIAQRRAGGALVDQDTSDVIAAGVAAAGYFIRNATTAVRLRAATRRMARAGLDPEGELYDNTEEHTE